MTLASFTGVTLRPESPARNVAHNYISPVLILGQLAGKSPYPEDPRD